MWQDTFKVLPLYASTSTASQGGDQFTATANCPCDPCERRLTCQYENRCAAYKRWERNGDTLLQRARKAKG